MNLLLSHDWCFFKNSKNSHIVGGSNNITISSRNVIVKVNTTYILFYTLAIFIQRNSFTITLLLLISKFSSYFFKNQNSSKKVFTRNKLLLCGVRKIKLSIKQSYSDDKISLSARVTFKYPLYVNLIHCWKSSFRHGISEEF